MKKQHVSQCLCLAVVTGLAILSAGTARAADQTKADNNVSLEQTNSWVGNAVPGSGDRAIWDGTLSAANCTNTVVGPAINVGQIQIKSPSGGVPVSITGTSGAWWRLIGVNGADIDMSAATVDLTIGSGFTIQTYNSSSYFTNQAGRTLTISGGLYVGNTGGKTLTLDGGGNYVLSSPGGALTGPGTLIKQGGGAVTITVPNYNTNFVLNAGTFNMNQNFCINGNANSTMTINGGTIDNTSGGAIGLTANPPIYFWNGDFIFAGTGTLNLGGGAVTLGGNRQVTCTNTLTVGGAIGDGGHSYSLTKAGAGNLTLSGANTYSGNTIVSAGTLALSGSGSISNSPNITIGSGGTFNVSGLTTALALGSGQTLNATATGANTTGTITGGSSKGLTLSAGGLVFTAFGGGSTAPLTASGAAGTMNLNGAPVTVTTTTALTANTYTLIDTASSGTVIGTPGTLTVNGSGLGANTIASLAVTSGKLVLTVAATLQVKADNNNSLNNGSSWVSGTAPSTSQWAVWNSTVATPANCTNALGGNVTWGGIQISNPSAAVNITSGSTLTLNGVGGVGIDLSSATVDLTIGSGVASTLLTVASNQLFSVASGRSLFISNDSSVGNNITETITNAGNVVISGRIFGGTGTNVVMSGTGALTLSGPNYLKNFVLNSGTLNVNHNFALCGNTAQALTINGGALDSTVNGISQGQAPALNLNGDLVFNGTYSLNYGTGAVTLGGNRQVTVSANTLTLGGAIGDGGYAYSLTKAGAGKLTLTAANTYTGNTTVSAGTLALSGSGSISSSNITVASGATLDVSGVTTALALGSGQTLNASATGTNTTGTITMGSSKGLTLSTGGLVFTAYGGGLTAPLTAGGAGSLNLNGAPITVTTTSTLPEGYYVLIAPGGGIVTGSPGTLTVNGSSTAAAATVSVQYGALILTVGSLGPLPGIVKADNAIALNQSSSWLLSVAPGGSDWAAWDGTYAATNLTNSFQASVTWGGILISSNVAPTGVPIAITNDAGNHSLNLNGIGGVAIDMSAATDDLFLGSRYVNINNNVSFTVAASRTLTLDQVVGIGTYTLTLNGAGNYIKGATERFYSSGAGALVMSGTGSLTLVGPNNSLFTTLNSGTLDLKHAFAYSGAVNSTLTINGGSIDNTSGSAMTILQSPTNVWNGDFTFVGSASLDLGSGVVTLGGNRQVTVNTNTLTVDGGIGDGGNTYSLTKAGAGKLTLTAANTYTGNTTISAGTLALSGSGSIASSNITVASGATLDVSGLTTALALGAGQTLKATATGANTTGTITMGSSKGLTLSAGGLVFTAYGGGLTAPLKAGTAGSLNLNGAPVTVTTTSTLPEGYYVLIAPGGGTVTGSPGTLTVNGSGAAAAATVSVQFGALILTVGPLGPLPGIVKADNAVALDQGSSWLLGVAPSGSQWATWSGTYTATNLTNAIQNYVTWGGILIASNVAPTGVPITITNYNNTYSLFLNGIGGVAIDMSAASDDLVLGSFRTYINNNESFNVGSGRTLTVLNNLQLQNYTLTLNGAGNYKLGAFYGVNPTSFATLVMSGSGAVTLTGPGYYLTNTTLNSGTMNLNFNTAISGFAGYGLTINGGTLDNTSGAALTVANSPTYQWNGDFAFAGTTNLGLGSGAVTLGGNRQVTVSANTLTVGGAIGDGGSGYSLTKTGAGTLALSGANTYTGNTTVSDGTLEIAQATLATNSTVNVASGAMLKLDFAVTNAVTDLIFGGVSQPGGVYNTSSSSGYISGTGSLLVTAGAASTNAQLANLVISNGAGALTFYPSAFTTNNLGIYYATNVFGAGPVTVLVTNVDATATNTLLLGGNSQGQLTNGLASSPLTLNVGSTNVTVQVVSQDLSVTNTYVVALTQLGSGVSSDASLSFLELSPAGALSPAFSSGVTNYTAGEANANSLVTVTVTNTSASATNVLFLNGTPQATNAGSLLVASLPLVVGSANNIQVRVTAQDGLTVSNYFVTVTRAASSNAGLTSLALTPAGTLYPSFATGTLNYTATNTCSGNPLTVTVTSADVTATNTLYLNGVSQGALTNGLASAPLTLVTGANTVTVQVVSQDLSVTNDYVVAATLTAPPTVSVNSVTNCGAVATLLTATTSASSPTYSWSPGGATTASITVTPSSTTIYTVTVTDGTTGCANSGSGTITVNPVPVVTVNSTNIYAGGTATLTATNAASSPTYLWSPGGATSQTITVSPSTNTTYTVTVTDGTTGCVGGGSGTVTILASTNALLSGLSISPGALSQTFNSGTTSYTATNTYPATNVTVTATSADGTATLALSFNTGGSYSIPLTNGVASVTNTMSLSSPANVLAVQVVSQDLSRTNVYTVNELLQPSQSVPKLTNSVSGNSLVLSWPADHLGYRLLVQTNNLNKGVSGNISDWGTVPGTATITTTNITIIKAGVTNAYYKLVYP